MINYTLPPPSTITDDIAKQIGSEVAELLHLPPNVTFEVTQEPEQFINTKWSVGDSSDSDRKINSELITMSYVEKVKGEDLINAPQFHVNSEPALIYDKAGLMVRPFRGPASINFTIKLHSKSKTKLANLINHFKLMLASGKSTNYHKVEYVYYLHPSIGALIYEIYTKRNKAFPPAITEKEYLETITDSRVTFIGTLAGAEKDSLIGFKEGIVNILGIYNTVIDDANIDFDKENRYYSFEIEYVTYFDKLQGFHVTYLPVIYGQMLGNDFITLERKGGMLKGYAPSTLVASFETIKLRAAKIAGMMNGDKYLHIPTFDRHVDIEMGLMYTTVFSILVEFDLSNPRFLFNLSNLGDFKLTDPLLDLLRNGEYEYITKHLESFIQLTMVINGVPKEGDYLTVDKDLNVFLTFDPNYVNNYKVLFNLVTDLRMITPEALERFKAFVDIFVNREPGKDISEYIVDLSILDEEASAEIAAKYALANIVTYAPQVEYVMQMKTHQISEIVAHVLSPK